MRSNRRRITNTVAFLPLLLLTGCVIFSSPERDEQSALDGNRALWTAAGIGDYTIRFQRTSTCIVCNTAILVPALLTVRGDTIREVFNLNDNQPIEDFLSGLSPCITQTVNGCRAFLTIDELFDFIQAAIDVDAVTIDISYDATLGYPIDIVVDYNRRFFDDEIGFQIREFTPN